MAVILFRYSAGILRFEQLVDYLREHFVTGARAGQVRHRQPFSPRFFQIRMTAFR